MKTKQPNQSATPSGTPALPMQAVSDSNRKATCKNYALHVYRARFEEGTHTIRAESREDALEKALKIKSGDLDDDCFYPIDSVIQVISVELEKEKQAHE